jgi:hypothetical protein
LSLIFSYKDAHSCHRALQKNGHIIGGCMVGVVSYSQFIEAHKDKLKGSSNATSMPLRNSSKDGQLKNYKAARPLLQQPMRCVLKMSCYFVVTLAIMIHF